MKFDVAAAVAEVLSETQTPATVATVATERPKSQPERESSSKVAEVAATRVSKTKTKEDREAVVVETIRAGNIRPGPVATATGFGATVSYQLIDRLVQQGRIRQAKDGSLSVAVASAEGGRQ